MSSWIGLVGCQFGQHLAACGIGLLGQQRCRFRPKGRDGWPVPEPVVQATPDVLPPPVSLARREFPRPHSRLEAFREDGQTLVARLEYRPGSAFIECPCEAFRREPIRIA